LAFQSFGYFLFLPVVLIAYYLLPHRFRWVLLLVGSYFFYMCWNAAYALLMLTSTAITFVTGLLIDREERSSVEASVKQRRKKRWVAVSFLGNLCILFFFKYANLFSTTVQEALGLIGLSVEMPMLNVLLPVGISFYTFQALGYTVDVYRGDVETSRHFGKYALFVSFFPQLVAGPIERSSQLLAQFDEIHSPDAENLRRGALLILLGLIKKLVIADRLAVLVDMVYANVGAYGAPASIVATVCFAFQIYCDFGGYSDIAVGSANLLGFRLMKNFDAPYLSRSIGEFWRRWHVSLSSWFRDYLYIPLGGSRVPLPRWVLNTMIVFVASGLWHGANWTFALWGALNGAYLVLGQLLVKGRRALLPGSPDGRWRQALSTITTFALVCFAWVFFRADSLHDVGLLLGKLVGGWEWTSLKQLVHLINGRECLLMALLVLALVASEMLGKSKSLSERILRLRLPSRWAVCLFMLFLLILLGKYNESPSFIYFQF
jgi:D-alanyl-lipoteichoic acid acyltransferase DltB (MBOAT superfamily)